VVIIILVAAVNRTAFIRFGPYYYIIVLPLHVSVVQVEMVWYSDDALGAGCAPRADRPAGRPSDDDDNESRDSGGGRQRRRRRPS